MSRLSGKFTGEGMGKLSVCRVYNNPISLHGVVLQNRENLYLYFGFFHMHAY